MTDRHGQGGLKRQSLAVDDLRGQDRGAPLLSDDHDLVSHSCLRRLAQINARVFERQGTDDGRATAAHQNLSTGHGSHSIPYSDRQDPDPQTIADFDWGEVPVLGTINLPGVN